MSHIFDSVNSCGLYSTRQVEKIFGGVRRKPTEMYSKLTVITVMIVAVCGHGIQHPRDENPFEQSLKPEDDTRLLFPEVQEKLKHLEDLVAIVLQQNKLLEKTVEDLQTGHLNLSRRLGMNAASVSFSAYLNHDINGKPPQNINFDVELQNDGGFYNKETGKFTAPIDGVYLFIYFMAQRGNIEVDVELLVNNVKVNDAVAEGRSSAYDSQGGNSAILTLKKGDEVRIATWLGNTVLGRWRLTTFSGALLYPNF